MFQGGLVGHLATLELTKGPIMSVAQVPLPPAMDRQGSWERGEIDYTGADRFSNIQAALDKRLSKWRASDKILRCSYMSSALHTLIMLLYCLLCVAQTRTFPTFFLPDFPNF